MSRAALVKQLQEGEEAWRKKALKCYADIANTTWQACRRWQEKEHELELATMRAKYGPRLDARASVEGAVAASLAEARLDLRLEKAKVAGLKEAVEDYEEVERERDELRAMVDALELSECRNTGFFTLSDLETPQVEPLFSEEYRIFICHPSWSLHYLRYG